MLCSQWIALKYFTQYDRLSQQQLSFLLNFSYTNHYRTTNSTRLHFAFGGRDRYVALVVVIWTEAKSGQIQPISNTSAFLDQRDLFWWKSWVDDRSRASTTTRPLRGRKTSLTDKDRLKRRKRKTTELFEATQADRSTVHVLESSLTSTVYFTRTAWLAENWE